MPIKKKSAGTKKKKKSSSSKSTAPKYTAEIGDGTVQGQKLQAEFLKKANEWIFKNTSRAIDLFRTFDTNGDGVLSHDEFRNGMARLKAPFTPEEVEAVIAIVDTDGSGDLDYKEFQHGLRYKHHAKVVSADGLPPLMVSRPPKVPCPHCGIGLWQPNTPEPRYIHLDVKLLPFHERSHPSHLLAVTVCDAINVYGVAQLVKKHLVDCAEDLTIYQLADASDESEMDMAFSLKDCGIAGGSRLHPTKVQLYYDYTPLLSACPVIMCEHYFTSEPRQRRTLRTT